MSRISIALVLGMTAFGGCGKTDTHERTARGTHGSQSNRYADEYGGANTRTGRYDDASRDEDFLNYEVREARRRIETVADQAEEAIRRTHLDLRSRAADAAEELEEAATELKEEAKDRAADLPDEIDRLFDRNFAPPRVKDWQSDEDGGAFTPPRRDWNFEPERD